MSLSDSNIYIGNYTSINDFHVRLVPAVAAAAAFDDKNSGTDRSSRYNDPLRLSNITQTATK